MELLSPVAIQHFLAAAVYSALGLILFAGAFVLVDKLTPGSLWDQVMVEKNTAVAILFGAWAIGLSVIIAAAISG